MQDGSKLGQFNPDFLGEHGFDRPSQLDASGVRPAFSGRFEDCGEIGQGGMGAVHDAYDSELGRHVAVKVMDPGRATSPESAAAFSFEARLMGRLEHPYIVPIHELRADDTSAPPHFVMKLVEGVNLAAWMRANNATADGQAAVSAALDQTLGFLIKVCDAIAFAHSRGVLHLDLKPANVMVGEHGQIYVMDWGVAVECTRDTDARLRPRDAVHGIRGTPGYMAPEQIDDRMRRVDERTDVYGLGAILYELLTTRTPYEPLGGPADLVFMREHQVIPPQEREPTRVMPPGLCAIAQRALAHEMDQRFPDVVSFRMALESFRKGGGWFETKHFMPGDVIVREGELGDEGYILAEGRCSVEQGQGEGRTKLAELGVGQVFGEAAVLANRARTASVIALTPVTVQVITRAAIERELEGQGWLQAFVRTIAERYVEVDAERAELRARLRRFASIPPAR
ncbi:MAG: serine/threonine-protein kinase [Myxococcales bacterium]